MSPYHFDAVPPEDIINAPRFTEVVAIAAPERPLATIGKDPTWQPNLLYGMAPVPSRPWAIASMFDKTSSKQTTLVWELTTGKLIGRLDENKKLPNLTSWPSPDGA